MAREKSAHSNRLQSAIRTTQTALPAVGSKLRECYDFLDSHRGKEVKVPFPRYMITSLIDFYGCNIKSVGHRTGIVTFVGEWHEDQYSDFLTDQFISKADFEHSELLMKDA